MNQRPEKTIKLGCLGPALLIAFIIAITGVPMALAFFGVEAFKTGRLTDLDHPERFDPIKHLPIAKKMAGPNLQMTQLIAQSVRADGTVDLTASWRPTVMFQYVAPNAAGDLPVGAPGTGDNIQLITIRADRPGWNATGQIGPDTYYDWSRGLTRLEPMTMPAMIMPTTAPPKCSFKKLWDEAIKRGAPRDAVANIQFRTDAYAFTIEGTPHAYRFDKDCAPLP